jgi:hypothetical protein
VLAMTQLLTSFPPTTRSFAFAPTYQCDLARTIGVLQQLQTLCAAQSDASLADVIRVVSDMQRDFGEDSQLENVIQALVGQHLGQQLVTRRQVHQLHQVEAMEVLP